MKRTILVAICAVVTSPWMLAAADKPQGEGKETESCPKPQLGEQKVCPVMGKPVKTDISTDYEGQKVLFCCKDCVDKFKAEPMRYLPAVYRQVYPQTVQVKCPVMGEDIDPKVFTEYNGQRVYFCCKGCDKKFTADPAKYTEKLAAGSTEQVHCPISGHAIDPKVSIEDHGRQVYFCCADCVDKYKAAPAKYAEAVRPIAGLLAYGKTAKEDLVLCPTCAEKGTAIKRGEAKIVEQDGISYAFCCDKCAGQFKADAAKYKRSLREAMVKVAGGPEKAYSCPMHPEVVKSGLGRCPLCDMALKPVAAK